MWWIVGIFIVIIILKQLLGHNISIKDAIEKFKNGAVLIDVRTPGEFASSHHQNAVNIPLGNLAQISNVVKDKKSPILLYCHSGSRAAGACAQLRRMDYQDVHNVGSYSRTKKVVNQN